MQTYGKLLFLILLAMVCADASAVEFSWTSPKEDKSIEYLGLIFGTVGTALSGPESGILGSVMQIFNIAVLTLGSIVVSYTIILSTINTAQEGEVMGRKWSSAWIPFRAAMGAALLIPAPTYSLIQILFMHITIMGVHAANQIWQVTIDTFSEKGFVHKSEIDVTRSEIDAFVNDLLISELCAKVWQEEINFNFSPVRGYPGPRGLWVTGSPGSSKYSNICGGVVIPGLPANVLLGVNDWYTVNLGVIARTATQIRPWAHAVYEAYMAPVPLSETFLSFLTGINTSLNHEIEKLEAQRELIKVLPGALRNISLQVESIYKTTPMEDPIFKVTEGLKNASKYGWIFSGSFYFSLVGAKLTARVPIPYRLRPNQKEFDELSLIGRGYYNRSVEIGEQLYISTETNYGNRVPFGLTIQQPKPQPGSLAESGYAEVTRELREKLFKIGNDFQIYFTEQYSDPLTSIRSVGSQIINACETLWFALMIAVAVALLIGCVFSILQPICYVIGGIASIIVPLLTFLISLFWSIGCVLAIYIPMVPYIVFTFTALGWLILVIETMIAAPIVALGIVSPAQEVMGKAAPAVMLITGVFLRPSLMVIGLVTAILLLKTVVSMINFGFSATISSNTGSNVGIFGIIAVITLYGGLILAIIHECFSLIYVLPDKILRWIGGHVEQSHVGQQTKELQKSVEKGAELGGNLMKGSAAAAGQAIASKAGGGNSNIMETIQNFIQNIGSASDGDSISLGDEGAAKSKKSKGSKSSGEGPGAGGKGPGASGSAAPPG